MSCCGPKGLGPLLNQSQLALVHTGLDGQQGSLVVACLNWAYCFGRDCGDCRAKLPAKPKPYHTVSSHVQAEQAWQAQCLLET